MARKTVRQSEQKEFVKEDTEMDNVVNFEEARKGLADGEPPSGQSTWIDELEEGTIFLVEEKNSFNFVCPQFLLLEHWEHAVRLYNYTKGDTQTFFVSKNKFCNRFALTEVISKVDNIEAMLKILVKEDM